MISQKPIRLWKYLRFKKNKRPKNVGRLFYLSWEDALWDIFSKKNVKKGSTVLVPEFFCGDVENNIRAHGYKIAYYPVSPKLTATNKQLTESVLRYKPTVLIIINAVGIRNQFFDDISWVKNLDKNSVLVEDSVHLTIQPSQLKFYKKNHFIIDSLRKVVPLQGSNLFARKNDLNFSAPPLFQSLGYATGVTFWWFLMNFFWNLAHLTNESNLSNWFTCKAQRTMKIGYDLIGDSFLPARGWPIFDFFQQFLDVDKIKSVKRKQVEFYEEKLANLPKDIFQKAHYTDRDKTELMAYPLVLPLKSAAATLKKIRSQGLLLNFELNDNQWSKKQKIIYLPLGMHVKESHQQKIINVLK